MRGMLRTVGFVLLAAFCLAGCKKGGLVWSGGEPEHGHGRYAGIGIYAPAQPWTRMVAAQQAKQTPAAQTIDDQAIIVVVDSATGEVRACGDMTGYCIGMNPWKTPLAASQLAPINLTQHAKQLVSSAPEAESAAPASPPDSQ